MFCLNSISQSPANKIYGPINVFMTGTFGKLRMRAPLNHVKATRPFIAPPRNFALPGGPLLFSFAPALAQMPGVFWQRVDSLFVSPIITR